MFNEKLDLVNFNRKSIFPFSAQMKEIEDFMSSVDESRPQHIYDILDPVGEQEDADDLHDLEPPDMSRLPTEGNEAQHPEQCKYKPIYKIQKYI